MKQTHCIFPKRYRKSVQQFALTHQGEKNQSSKKTNSPPQNPTLLFLAEQAGNQALEY